MVVNYIIAKSIKNKEYMFSKRIVIGVTGLSQANSICNYLNSIKFNNLKDDETYHVYENDFHYNDYINYKAFIRKNKITIKRIYW